MITRRSFIAGSLAAACFGNGLMAARASQPPLTLRASSARARLLGQGRPETEIWGYNGTSPGPMLRVRKGEKLRVALENALPQPTTVHWHGVRIDNAMDGVPDVTQAAIAPGETFNYEFTAPDAGTYWYHSHNRSWEQVARGLHGVLIVEEEEPPQVDQDVLLVLDDWRLGEDGGFDSASLGHMMDMSHAGRLGNVITVSGQAQFARLNVRSGERIRLRLCNVANSRMFDVRLEGHKALVVALDGQPVEPFEPGARGLPLAPAQRADLIFDASAEPGTQHQIVLGLGDGEVLAGEIHYDKGAPARTHQLDAPMRLVANDLPGGFDVSDAREVQLLMQGGAMGRMGGAMFGGLHMGMRQLVNAGMVWAFNGTAGETEQPLFSARKDEPVVLEIINDTGWPHAMHWHGHHAFILEGGSAERDGVWRDTVLSLPGERMKVGFVADNPGKWLLHCHMLEHQAAGMSTWFEVGA